MSLAVRSQGHKQLNHQEESFVWIEICRCDTSWWRMIMRHSLWLLGRLKNKFEISLGVLFIDVKQAETTRFPRLCLCSGSMFISYLIKFEGTDNHPSFSSFLFRVQRRKSSEREWTTDDTITHDTNKRTILIHWSIDTRHQWTHKYLFIYFSHFVDDRDCFLEDVLSDQRSNFIEIFSSLLLIKRLNEFRSGELFPIDQPRSRRSLNWKRLERGGANVYWPIPVRTLSMRWKREIVKHRWFTKTRFEEKNSLAELFFSWTTISSSSSFGDFLFEEGAKEEIVEREVWRSSVVLVDWRLFCVSEYLCDQWANLSTLS